MKKRNKVAFTYLDFYYFGRCLGKDKVPESGNNPLGMEICHFSSARVDIHRKNTKFGVIDSDCIITSTPHSKQNDVGFHNSLNRSSKDMDSMQSVFSIDYTSKSLQPMNPRQRIKCLKDAGVEMVKDQLSADESKYLVKLRLERQQVGCKCTGANPCDPTKCACSKEGIPCQSDGNLFPCKCGPKCANDSGRRVYSNLRIKYHYSHTLKRELSEQCISTVTENGDCKLCSEIQEDALHQLFAVSVEPKRKRVANTRNGDLTKPQKTQKQNCCSMESVPEGICPAVEATVMAVSSSLCPPLIYDHLVTTEKCALISKEIDGNKENIGLGIKSQSPEKVATTYSPIAIPGLASLTRFTGPWINTSPFLIKKMTAVEHASVVAEARSFIDSTTMDGIITAVKSPNDHISTEIIEEKLFLEKNINGMSPRSSHSNDSWSHINCDSDTDLSPASNSYFLDSFINRSPETTKLLSPFIPKITSLNPIVLAADIAGPGLDHDPSSIFASQSPPAVSIDSRSTDISAQTLNFRISQNVVFENRKDKEQIENFAQCEDTEAVDNLEEGILMPFVEIVSFEEPEPTTDDIKEL